MGWDGRMGSGGRERGKAPMSQRPEVQKEHRGLAGRCEGGACGSVKAAASGRHVIGGTPFERILACCAGGQGAHGSVSVVHIQVLVAPCCTLLYGYRTVPYNIQLSRFLTVRRTVALRFPGSPPPLPCILPKEHPYRIVKLLPIVVLLCTCMLNNAHTPVSRLYLLPSTLSSPAKSPSNAESASMAILRCWSCWPETARSLVVDKWAGYSHRARGS